MAMSHFAGQDGALAQPRIYLTIVRALLGLLFLAWLPAFGIADLQDRLSAKPSDLAWLVDLSDGEESEDGARADGFADADGGTDDPALPMQFHPHSPVTGTILKHWERHVAALVPERGACLQATGPPSA